MVGLYGVRFEKGLFNEMLNYSKYVPTSRTIFRNFATTYLTI